MASTAKVSNLLLQNIPLFSMVSEATLSLLVLSTIREKFPKGHSIITAGEHTNNLYMLISGEVKIFMNDKKKKEILITKLKKGDFFGHMGLLDNSRGLASVMTTEDAEILFLSKIEFNKCLKKDPNLVLELLHTTVHYLRAADAKISSLALLSVYERVINFLIKAAKIVDDKRAYVDEVSKQDIAEVVGASREMVGKVLNSLEMKGVIQIHGRAIILCRGIDSLAEDNSSSSIRLNN